MRSAQRWLSLFAFAWLCFSLHHEAVGQTDAQVKQLIDQLDNAALNMRRQATDTLEGYIKNNQLTADQYGILRTYPENPPLELLRRKEMILSRWTTTYPKVEKVLNKLRYLNEEPKFLGDTDWDYKFDGFFGRAQGFDQPAQKFAAGLLKKDATVRNAVASADGAQIFFQLGQLRTFVDMNYPVVGGHLHDNENRNFPVDKQDVLDLIDAATFDATAAFNDIDLGSNNMQGPARPPKPVGGMGALDVGRTLRLGLALNPVANGDLEMFLSQYRLAFSRAPAGYRFVGELFHLTPSDSLDVTGNTITIGLEYGEFDLYGDPITDPSELRIARFANGKFSLLDPCTSLSSCVINPESFLVRGFYAPDPGSLELDQFGEFVLVRQIPEPATLALLATGFLGLIASQRSRRRRQ